MIADVLGSGLFYTLLIFGVGWPLASRLKIANTDKILVSVVFGLLGIFFSAWIVYVFTLSKSTLWILPFLSALAIVTSRQKLVEFWRDETVRDFVIAQATVTFWCVGWLALTLSYSGGFWIGDWFGHWQRVEFFLERGPLHILFNGFDPLTSRPPMGNVIVGALLTVTRIDFAHYQLASTIFGSLAFLPAAFLARHFGGRRAIAVLGIGLMLNPMFVQNATFAWTKLPAAFFILAGIYFFLRSAPEGPGAIWLFLCAASLGCALLTHYSAGPYVVILAAAWLLGGMKHWRAWHWWRTTLFGGLIGGSILACWFGWGFGVYGVKGMLLTNTTITDQAPSALEQMKIAILNIRDTIVPHFFRPAIWESLQQSSRLGWWRDWFFQLYQVNLLFSVGSVGWLVVAIELLKKARESDWQQWFGWTIAALVTVGLGVAVVSVRDPWGLAHICLQPVVLLSLGFLSARWDLLPAGWKIAVIAGVVFDFIFGILVHFGIQSFLVDEWLTPSRTRAEIIGQYSESSAMNLRAKLQQQWTFLGDEFASRAYPLVAVLTMILLFAVIRMRRSRKPAGISPS